MEENKNIELAKENESVIEAKSDTMTVAEFIELYESDTTKNKTSVKSALKIVPYLSYGVKILLANNIINHANMDEDGNIVLNSPARYLFYAFTLINSYTNVKIDPENIFSDFDELNSRGLVDYLTKQIPEKELAEFTTVVDMVADDLIANKYEIHAYINELYGKLSTFFAEVITPLSNEFNGFSDKIKDLDVSKINEALSAISNIGV